MINFILILTVIFTSIGGSLAVFAAYRFCKDIWNYLNSPLNEPT